VRYRADQLRARLGGDVHIIEAEASARLWRDVADVTHLAARAGDIWRIALRPSDAGDFVAQLGADPLQDVVYDWGGGLVWLALPEGRGQDVASAVAGRGAAVLWRGAQAAPFADQSAEVAALSRGLKAQFDPRGILNAGLL
jgi:glycolate oxidase FAD binding subunit